MRTLFGLLVFSFVAAHAQDNEIPPFLAGPTSRVVVTDAPFSAEGQSHRKHTLADGTHIVAPLLPWKFYRDSAGRMRIEHPILHPNADAETAIEITDPVAKVMYSIDSKNKVAHRQRWNAPSALPVFPRSASEESLGTETIEGLLCEGSRNTATSPVGSIGNDRPISVVTEFWKAKDLQLVVLYKYSDPQSGEQLHKLVNIHRDEPSAQLFLPPHDYTTEDYGQTAGAYPLGGDVSPPVLISKTEPSYSEEASQAHISGAVLLSITIGADGLAHNIKVVRPLGFGLDEKAVEAVKKWRFRPGKQGGQPVPVAAQVEVTFRLLANPN